MASRPLTIPGGAVLRAPHVPELYGAAEAPSNVPLGRLAVQRPRTSYTRTPGPRRFHVDRPGPGALITPGWLIGRRESSGRPNTHPVIITLATDWSVLDTSVTRTVGIGFRLSSPQHQRSCSEPTPGYPGPDRKLRPARLRGLAKLLAPLAAEPSPVTTPRGGR